MLLEINLNWLEWYKYIYININNKNELYYYLYKSIINIIITRVYFTNSITNKCLSFL